LQRQTARIFDTENTRKTGNQQCVIPTRVPFAAKHQAWAYRGEADRAFEWLEKAVAYQDGGLSEVLTEPLFVNLYTGPRWPPFLKRIGRSPG